MALRYHPGARLVFADGTPDILAYPRDRAGWGRLTRLLTLGNLRAEKGDCILYLDDLLAHIDGLELVVMEECTREASPLFTSPLAGEVDQCRLAGMIGRGVSDERWRLFLPPSPTLPRKGGGSMPCLRRGHNFFRFRSAAPGRVRLAASMLYRGNDRARLAKRVEERAKPACR